MLKSNIKRYYGPFPYSMEMKYEDLMLWPHNYDIGGIERYVEWHSSDLQAGVSQTKQAIELH